MGAIFLDFDGVVCNSELYFHKYEWALFKKLIPELDSGLNTQFIGRNLSFIYNSLNTNFQVNFSFEEFQSMYYEICDKVYYEHADLEKNVKVFVKEAYYKKNRLAIVSSSNKKYIDYILKKYDIKKYIELIVSVEDVGDNTKPSSYPYKLAMKKMNVSGGLAIEDSEIGIESAKKAGLYVYALKNNSIFADSVINDILEVDLDGN